MNIESLCSSIRASFREQWECATAPQGNIRVRTPYIYPDGGILDLFIVSRSGRYKLTDFGETVDWLLMRSGIENLAPKRLDQIHDVCKTHGVEFNRGQLELSGVAESDLPNAVVQLAGAAARTSDLWYTIQRDIADEVTVMENDRLYEDVRKWLVGTGVSFEARTSRLGRSGRDWLIDFETHTNSRTVLVFLMTAGYREEAHRITEQVLAACLDLSLGAHSQQSVLAFPEQRDIVKVSLFHNAQRVWRKEDFRLMEHASEVVHWPDLEELGKVLRAA